jgi:hypothetical protein
LKAGGFNIRTGKGRFLYRFHFMIEQALDTGEVEEDTGKVLKNPCLSSFRALPNPLYSNMTYSVVCPGRHIDIR